MRPEVWKSDWFLIVLFCESTCLGSQDRKKTNFEKMNGKKKQAVFPKKNLETPGWVGGFSLSFHRWERAMCENHWKWSYEHDRCPNSNKGHFGPSENGMVKSLEVSSPTNPENPRKLMKRSPTKNNVGILLKEWGSGNFCRFIHISKGWIRRFLFQGNWSSTPLSYETNQRCPATGHPNGPKVASALHLQHTLEGKGCQCQCSMLRGIKI